MYIEDFLLSPGTLLDVRSPSEFLQGHIPKAISHPLFSDEERAQVGTLYKQKGKDVAVQLGLELFGPKMASYAKKALEIAGPSKQVRLYCARGGMRSSSIMWLLETAGLYCSTLSGGYKIFRRWTLDQLAKKYAFWSLGGFTGSGKTEVLSLLKRHGEQVLDLEKIANHKGSAFGHIGQHPQPTAQHFENLLAFKLLQCDLSRPIWVEDESRMIGSCPIPQDFWNRMKLAPLLWIQSPKEKRLDRIEREYGHFPATDLIQASLQLTKKLGLVKTREVVSLIEQQETRKAFSLILQYYDQKYSEAETKLKRKRIDFVDTPLQEELIEHLLQFTFSQSEKYSSTMI